MSGLLSQSLSGWRSMLSSGSQLSGSGFVARPTSPNVGFGWKADVSLSQNIPRFRSRTTSLSGHSLTYFIDRMKDRYEDFGRGVH